MVRISTRGALVLFDVHVVPRASRTAVIGLHGEALKVALAAPPVEGAANAALIELFAKLLGRPRRTISIARGESSRQKTLAVEGMAAAELEAQLVRLIASAGTR